MELYGQDAELRLLRAALKHLTVRTVVDVGAERGELADGLLDAGAEELHAIDPHPDNARELADRFGSDPRVKVHEYAVSDADGSSSLRLSSRPDGTPISWGHTLLDAPDTGEIVWRESVPVTRRSLASMVETGELPARVGILKVDTEGNDLAVLRGIGDLRADLVMVEHWTDLPFGLGPCPWTAADLVATLRPRGFTHFAFIVHHGEFVTLKWDDGDIERGAMGNLVFVHDELTDLLLPELLYLAGSLSEEAVRVANARAQAADERMEVIRELEQVAEERLTLIRELSQQLEQANARIVALEAEREQLGLA
jgi:FkbM family methyltransferase